VAFIVLRPETPCTEKDLIDFALQRIAKFKLPRRFEFLDHPLPKGGTGKILKRELREKFWAGKDRRVQGVG
jgi:acyl-CoA synthetase (AMP-forming)/AMP-acid ligase II